MLSQNNNLILSINCQCMHMHFSMYIILLQLHAHAWLLTTWHQLAIDCKLCADDVYTALLVVDVYMFSADSFLLVQFQYHVWQLQSLNQFIFPSVLYISKTGHGCSSFVQLYSQIIKDFRNFLLIKTNVTKQNNYCMLQLCFHYAISSKLNYGFYLSITKHRNCQSTLH